MFAATVTAPGPAAQCVIDELEEVGSASGPEVYGTRLQLEGERLVVVDPQFAVDVYDPGLVGWDLTQRVLFPDADPEMTFGAAVALSGATLMVGRGCVTGGDTAGIRRVGANYERESRERVFEEAFLAGVRMKARPGVARGPTLPFLPPSPLRSSAGLEEGVF